MMLKGKSVLVTGSTSGIGKGMAEAFAGAGCNIMINGFGDAEEINSFLKDMKVKKWGRIINIASAHGLVASPFKSAYVAAKHGMVGLTKTRNMDPDDVV
ncbi:MAG: SDR family NAD(P)-dependent oxidoreductase, partial [Desulfosalsimonadaceae bacterium]|nr:SDR family NAD(P)-dependent oxidoreductase [Desulfosalsimonadaceae bacterium]